MVYIILALVLIQLIVICLTYVTLFEFTNTQHQCNKSMINYAMFDLQQNRIVADEIELLLWKTRYDMTVWKEQCIENEEYEAVEGIQAAIDKAEELIEKYRKLNTNETDNN